MTNALNFEYLVIGSGPSGAHAAQTLVESNVNVGMMDVGLTNDDYDNSAPAKSFIELRQTDHEQYKYLIGKNFEGIFLESTKVGAQLTPSRRHIIKDIEKYIPLISNNFRPMETLALGGLGSGWGLGCCCFSDAELQLAGLDPLKMSAAYDVISERIGVSANIDRANPYTIKNLKNTLPPLDLDNNSRLLFRKYQKTHQAIEQQGFYMGHPALALLTQDKGSRKKYDYNEMGFYQDHGQSAYRPWITIKSLQEKPNFKYVNNKLVTHYEETETGIIVHFINTESNEKGSVSCKKLILATGTLGSARIVLRSNKSIASSLPILCNPYHYLTCIQPRMLGKAAESRRSNFAQLSLFYDKDKTNSDVSMASIYSYQSLMLYKTIKETPLNAKDALKIMQYLVPAISIVGIHHPNSRSENRFLKLADDNDSITGDQLLVNFRLTESEEQKIDQIESNYKRILRKLSCYPIKTIKPGNGASIHYAGTLPFSDKNEQFHINPGGRLGGTKNIYIADGSGFKYLPAKGITFSLMANAHLVAKNALND